MNEKFSKEIRQEALKLAEEIGTAATAQRLGMLYTWKQKSTKGIKDYGTGVPEKSYEELKAENERLKKENHRLK
jgi:transposase-like protein